MLRTAIKINSHYLNDAHGVERSDISVQQRQRDKA